MININKTGFSHNLRSAQQNPIARNRVEHFLRAIYPAQGSLRPPRHLSGMGASSILQNPALLTEIAQSEWAQMLDARLFAHVVADSFLHESDLEGNTLEQTTSFFSKMIPFLQSKRNLFNPSAVDRFQTILSQLRADLTPKQLAIGVSNLQPGQSLFMRGGWKGTSQSIGHAMIYEFYRRPDGNYDLIIYNTGDGTRYHAKGFKGEKLKIQRRSTYANILPQEFGLSEFGAEHIDFFEDLVRCRDHKHTPYSTTSAEQIYAETLAHLSCKKLPPDKHPALFKTPQRAGTCSEYVLKEVSYKHLCEENPILFKRKHFYKRFYATVGFFLTQFNLLSENDPSSAELRLLLKGSSMKLLRASAKLYDPKNEQASILSEQEALEAQLTLSEIKDYIESIEAEIQTSNSLTKPFLFQVSDGKQQAAQILSTKVHVAKTKMVDCTTLAPSSPSRPTGASFQKQLQATFARSSLVLRTDPLAALQEIEQVFQELPIPQANVAGLCEQIPIKAVGDCIDTLYQLIELHANLCLTHTSYCPSQQNNALTMLAYLHRLSLIQDAQNFGKKARLDSFAIEHAFEKTMEDPLLIFYNPKDFERRKQLLQYFKHPTGLEPAHPLCHFPAQIALRGANESDAEGDYLLSIIRQNPTLQKRFEQLEQRTIRNGDPDLRKAPIQTVQRAIADANIFDPSFLNSSKESHIFKLRAATYLINLMDRRLKSPLIEGYEYFIFVIDNNLYIRRSHQPVAGPTLYHDDLQRDATEMYGRQGLGKFKFENKKFLYNHPVFERKQTEALSEADVIDRWKTLPLPPSLPCKDVLAVTNCAPLLQPTKTLFHYMENLSELDTPGSERSVQILFDLLFFKPSMGPTTTIVPIFEELPQNLALQKQCADFIQQGIHYFYFMQPGHRPKIETCLFFIRLGLRLQTIHPREGFNPLSLMQEWLQNETLTTSEKSQIHLHRVLYYASRDFNQLSDQEIGEMLGSWFFHRCNPIDLTSQNPYLNQEAQRALYSISSLLENKMNIDPKARESIINCIFSTCNLQMSAAPWSGTYPVFQQQNPHHQDRFWKINLLKSMIVNESGLLSAGLDFFIYNERTYQTLFGQTKFPLQKMGEQYFLNHPQYGEMRISPPAKQDGRHCFLRNIGGSWFQYIDPVKDLLPIPLTENHAYWRSTDPSKPCVHIYPLHDPLHPAATVQEDLSIAIHRDGSQLLPVENLSTSWEQFAKQGMYIPSSKKGGSSLDFLRVPAYRSLANQELQFKRVNDRFYWVENPSFYVLPEQPVHTGIPNALVLANESGEKKLLVPVRKIQKSSSLAPQIELETKEKTTDTHFLEYDLRNHNIIAQQIEGVLFYAYILLAKKQYREAARQIDSIPEGAPLSSLSIQLLQDIILLPALNLDLGPISAALRLRAVQHLDARDNPLTEDELKQIREMTLSAKLIYDNSHTNVPFDLRLPPHNSEAPLSLAFIDKMHSLKSFLDSPTLTYRSLDLDRSFPVKNLLDSMQKPRNEFVPTIEQEFVRFYTLARNVKTDAEKIQLAALLRYVKTGDTSLALDLIHFALLYPDRAPPAPPQISEAWCQDLVQRYHATIASKAKGRLFAKAFSPASSSSVFPIQPRRSIVKPLPNTRPEASVQTADITLPPIGQEEMHPLSLEQLSAQFFQPIREVHPSPPDSFDIQPIYSEDPFSTASLAELWEFQEDYQAGAQNSAERVSFEIKQGQDLHGLQKALHEKIAEQKRALQAIETKIFSFVNKQAETSTLRIRDELLRGGEALIPMQLQELISIFHREDFEQYKRVNPYLTKRDIEELNRALFDFLLAETELAQAKRGVALVQALLSPTASNPKALIHQLATTLNARIAYAPHIEKTLLVFEHRAGIRLRANQAALIQKMLEIDPMTKQYRNIVAQLMMGGGKTTVIASLLLELAAKPGRLAILIGPAAQFETLRANVSFAQKKHFFQEVVAIELPRNRMNSKSLAKLLAQFHEASAKRSVILMKAETMQSLQLEFLSLLKQRRETLKSGLNPSKELEKSIFSLHALLKLLATRGDGLIDEVDVVFAPQKVVNFPTGDMEPILPSRVDCMRQIALLHVSDTLQVPGQSASVNQLLQLRAERPDAIDIEQYKAHIRPVIVRELFSMMHAKWKIDPRFADSFERYVLGNLKRDKLSAQDLAFLQHFNALGKSKDSKEHEIANEIALCKLYFTSILPSVLSKKVNRNFGRTRGSPAGKVVTFLGVDSPAPTEIANPFEAAFKHFLTALQVGISVEQIKMLAHHMNEAAEHYSQKEETPYDQTAEAKEFFELTGVALHEINQPGKLEKAAGYVNENLERVMMLEAETICSIVGSHPLFFSSNAQNLDAQLHTKRTLSATPFNYPSYSQELKANLALQQGVEGEIAHTLVMRNSPIRTYKQANIKHILQSAVGSGTSRERLRGFIDVSGILASKGSDNEAIARQILEFYQDDPSIEYVLFYGRGAKTDQTPDQLMVLRKSHPDTPQKIGTTNHAVLRQLGIVPERTFIYYDERHCEATDLPQKSDAINLISFNETTKRRDFFQGALRLRQFFEGQDVECVISEESREKLPNKARSIGDILQVLCQNQAVFKAEENYRSYQYKLEHVPRQQGIQKLLDAPANINSLQSIYDQYEKVFLTDQTIRPFEQYGGLEELLDTQEILAHKAQDLSSKIATSRLSKLIHHISNRQSPYTTIIQEAQKDPHLPTKVSSQVNVLGQTMEVQRELQLDTQLEQELEQELQIELLEYRNLTGNEKYSEKSWKSDAIPKTTPVGTRSGRAQIHTLQDVLSSRFGPKYKHPYSKIFAPNILVSSNFVYTYNQCLPVFHKTQKMAHQLLIIAKEKTIEIVLLSSADAEYFKRQLRTKAPANIWLMLPDGREISTHRHVDLNPSQEKMLARGLLQVNLFNGNAKFLSRRETETEDFFKQDLELKRRFLKLKVENDKSQRTIFYRNAILSGKEQRRAKVVHSIARAKI